MGGFQLYDGNSSIRRLGRKEVADLVKRGLLLPPTEDEIKDKSKGDWVTKGAALLQIVWFLMQCIARTAEGLPITELELVTAAYTSISICCYCFWWKKPLGVGVPVRVYHHPNIPRESVPDAFAQGFEHVGLSADGKRYNRSVVAANACSLFVAIVFGGIHCAAWSWANPYRKMWRVCSVIIVSIPSLGLVWMAYGLVFFSIKRGDLVKLWVMYPLAASSNFIITCYGVARMILLALAIMSLTNVAPLAYQAIDWVIYFPHI